MGFGVIEVHVIFKTCWSYISDSQYRVLTVYLDITIVMSMTLHVMVMALPLTLDRLTHISTLAI